jgi:phage terminase small subunit
MQPGTKPKPTKLKLIEGVGKHRINHDEPKPRPVAPECPDFLSDTAESGDSKARLQQEAYNRKLEGGGI